MLEAALEAALEEASEPLHAACLRVRLAEALQRWRWRDEEPPRRGARRASLTTAAGLAGLARLARWRQLQAGWRRLCAPRLRRFSSLRLLRLLAGGDVCKVAVSAFLAACQ